MRFTMHFAAGLVVATLVAVTPALRAQAPSAAPATLITGTFNAELTVTNADASVAFYRDVLGFAVQAGRRGGGPPANTAASAAPGAPAAPAAARQGGAGAGGAGRLTGAIGGQPRITRMVVPGATWQLELIEMTNIERMPVNPRRQDVGASGLILFVRDVDAIAASLKKANARILTAGGEPVAIGQKGGKSRGIVAQDPDGFILDIRQLDPLLRTTAPDASNIVDVGMTVSVRSTDETIRYWHGVLDFSLEPAKGFSGDKAEMALMGTTGAEVRKTTARHPNSNVQWEFLEFRKIERRELMPRIQDPGNAAFIVLTDDMDKLVERLHASKETKILSQDGQYVPRGTNGGAIFFQEMNGFILEGCKGC